MRAYMRLLPSLRHSAEAVEQLHCRQKLLRFGPVPDYHCGLLDGRRYGLRDGGCHWEVGLDLRGRHTAGLTSLPSVSRPSTKTKLARRQKRSTESGEEIPVQAGASSPRAYHSDFSAAAYLGMYWYVCRGCFSSAQSPMVPFAAQAFFPLAGCRSVGAVHPPQRLRCSQCRFRPDGGSERASLLSPLHRDARCLPRVLGGR